jgi:hypothetical protein
VSSQPPVGTEVGEHSLALIVSRLDDYLRIEELQGPDEPTTGRHLLGRFGHLQNQNALVDIVAGAESFATTRLRILRPMVTETEIRTWESRKRAWSKHAQVSLEKCPSWQALIGFVEVRNSIQHGLGRITEFQFRRRAEVLAAIKASGVVLDGDTVRLNSGDVRRCASDCMMFVSWLDNIAPTSL